MVRHFPMRVGLTTVLLSLLPAAAGAVDLSGRARAWVGGGVDTNPPRNFIGPNETSNPDAVAQGIVNLSGALAGERGQLSAGYDIGGRKFITQQLQDTLVQSAELDGVLWLPHGFGFALTGRARDRRGADREYNDLAA